jgi:glutathione synthase/RimK-type ligase-like ATP-grasp enzyme
MASKKVLILGGLATDITPHTPYGAGFAAVMPDYEFTEARFDHLTFRITPDRFSIVNGNDDIELSSYGLIIFRGKIRKSSGLAYVVSRYCLSTQTPFFNDYSNYRPSSKLAQAVLFYEQRVPFVETYYSAGREKLIALCNNELSYPFILKDSFGAHGKNNFLVKDEAELHSALNDNPAVDFIAQKYLPNVGDYRVLVIGDLPPLQIWRSAVSGSHLNNTSQGGSGTLVKQLTPELLQSAQQIAKRLKMSVSGVDVLKSSETGEHYFLEVNSQPQLLTGAVVGEKMTMFKSYLENLLGD